MQFNQIRSRALRNVMFFNNKKLVKRIILFCYYYVKEGLLSNLFLLVTTWPRREGEKGKS